MINRICIFCFNFKCKKRLSFVIKSKHLFQVELKNYNKEIKIIFKR